MAAVRMPHEPFGGRSGGVVPAKLMYTQITGGRDRGRRIRSASSLRPTSERVRAAIFSMLGAGVVQGARVLDLYAGTGAMGIEALSRGAIWAEFVEVDAGRCKDIRETLLEMGLTEQSHVLRSKVEKALDLVEGGFGLVLIDPPYATDPWDGLLMKLQSGQLLSEGALVVAEHFQKTVLADRYGRLVKQKDRRHGDTMISIYK
jgi:16S rRNA (guanine(966)-N(2))-methyltransferase RsmD